MVDVFFNIVLSECLNVIKYSRVIVVGVKWCCFLYFYNFVVVYCIVSFCSRVKCIGYSVCNNCKSKW